MVTQQNRFAGVHLYVLLTESLCAVSWEATLRGVLRGGAQCVQLREKFLPDAVLLERARTLVKHCRRHGAVSIINDRPDIALLSNADGIHLGQSDLPCAEARKLLGHNAIIGVSTENLTQARQALHDGASYIAVGPMFPTTTKIKPRIAGPAYAQGQITSGTVSGSGTGPYTFHLSFSDDPTALSPVGSVWYAWTPGFFYLPGVPTAASAPAGWAANVSGDSVQFTANSPANDILPGGSLSGFSYTAAFSPAQLAAAPNSGRSVAYSGGLFSDAGDTFTVQPVAAPEPSTVALLLAGSCLLARRRTRASPTP